MEGPLSAEFAPILLKTKSSDPTLTDIKSAEVLQQKTSDAYQDKWTAAARLGLDRLANLADGLGWAFIDTDHRAL
jgi:hypothetical protein